jgi:hypothetical protein
MEGGYLTANNFLLLARGLGYHGIGPDIMAKKEETAPN